MLVHWLSAACLRSRREESCRACVEACPVAALDPVGRRIDVAESCVGCGRCVAVCPGDALWASGFDLAGSPPAGAVSVDCWRVPTGAADGLTVPCLGGLTLRHLGILVEKAAGRPIWLMDRGLCGSCPSGTGSGHPASSLLRECQALFSELGIQSARVPMLRAAPLPPGRPRDTTDGPPVSRRGLLGRLFSGPRPAEAQERRLHGAAARAELLAVAARLLPSAEARLPARLFHDARVADGCRHHRICAASCPTSALRLWEDDQRCGLTFDTIACIGCRLCEAACPEAAIAITPAQEEIAAGHASRRLTSHASTECRSCGRDFVGDGAVCGQCQSTRLAAPPRALPREEEMNNVHHSQ